MSGFEDVFENLTDAEWENPQIDSQIPRSSNPHIHILKSSHS
jgi:hypothetical protein